MKKKHLNTLAAAAAAGDRFAQEALRKALYVPHHQRGRRVGGRKRTGYSGDKSRPYVQPKLIDTAHFTAKTHVPIPCRATCNDIDARVARIQMLQARG